VASLWDVPRCDEAGYRVWGRILGKMLEFVRSSAREVQLLASLPIPHETFEKGLAMFLEGELLAAGSGGGIASAFLQIAYPWLATQGSAQLPGGAEPPEGALAGILAVNALTRGAFTSAAGSLAQGAYALVPTRFESRCGREVDEAGLLAEGGAASLCERLSLFDRVPSGIQLITDVTASLDRSYRPAAVNRLIATLVRAARTQGTATLFEPNAELTWRAVERSLGAILTALYEEGGLRGANVAEAFSVACNRSTMTQNDLDNGRLIAQVIVQPSVPVERIIIALTLADGGRLALRGGV
jgi:phage tail sheath protein FI